MNVCDVQEKMLGCFRAVVIENDFVRLTVLPGKGGDIYELYSKANSLDLLWKSPWGLRLPNPLSAAFGGSEAAWMDVYEGGWQTIFPNGGDPCTYKGASLGFHGEASTLPWEFTIESATSKRIELRLECQLARSPFLVQRTIVVEADSPAIYITDTVTNQSQERLHFMWGHHPALGSEFLDGCQFHVMAEEYLPTTSHISGPGRALASERFKWPIAKSKGGTDLDLSVIPPLSERVSELGYLMGLTTGQFVAFNRRLSCGLRFHWDVKVFPYLWYWLEWGGTPDYPWYGKCRVAALEIFNSIPGSGLLAAIESGTAPMLGGRQSVTTELRIELLTHLKV